MRITQDTFSFLPDFTDEQVAAQVRYCIANNWAVSVEYTDDPHPRNAYWEMWGLPMFDQKDANAVMLEVARCREDFPNHYIKVIGYDSTKGRQSTMLTLIVNRPDPEPGFELERTEAQDRRVQYTIRSKR
jgi:ribulose-bisphosphate carboxylase small chain